MELVELSSMFRGSCGERDVESDGILGYRWGGLVLSQSGFARVTDERTNYGGRRVRGCRNPGVIARGF